MVQVFGILTAPSGRPMQRQTVRITRLPAGNPFDAAKGAVIQVGAYDTDTDGRWDADLIPSANFEDTGQYYQADCQGGVRNPDAIFTFRVPSSGGPYNIRDLLVTPLSTGTPIPPVAAHPLGSHSDVDTTGEADGLVLKFDAASGKWKPQPDIGGGGGGGGVSSVTAGNGTIVIGGTLSNPTVAVGTGIPESAITNLVADLAAKYVKPGSGIPAADLAAAVVTSLGKADTAVQPGSLATLAFTGQWADILSKPAALTQIAGLTFANNDLIQQKAGVLTNRTPAQLKTDLALTKSDVGLANVDNTSDVNKPISTATQTALNGKQPLDSDLTAIAGLAPAADDLIQFKAGAWTNRTPAQLKTDLALTKSDVGLANVDNTSDVNKPVSTAQQTALDGKQPLDSDLTAIAALSPADGAFIERISGAWASRTGSQVKTDLGLATVATTGAYADLSGKPTIPVIGKATLTDAATVATDASLGDVFVLDLTAGVGASRTLGAPINATDGMHRTWRFRQDGTGGKSVTLASGAGGFTLGSLIPDTNLNTAANKVGYMTAYYDSTANRWHVLAFEPGV